MLLIHALLKHKFEHEWYTRKNRESMRGPTLEFFFLVFAGADRIQLSELKGFPTKKSVAILTTFDVNQEDNAEVFFGGTVFEAGVLSKEQRNSKFQRCS